MRLALQLFIRLLPQLWIQLELEISLQQFASLAGGQLWLQLNFQPLAKVKIQLPSQV